MNIKFNAQHIKLTDAMKAHCEHDKNRLFRHYPNLSDFSVSIIYHESYKRFDIELKAHLNHQWYYVKFSGPDFNLTVSEAMQGLEHELDKAKTKVKKSLHDTSMNARLTSE